MKTIACFAALVIAATVATAAAPAFAGATGAPGAATAMSADGRSALVGYGTRELASPEGAAAVLWRIKVAAQRVCRNRDGAVEGLKTAAACRTRAVAAAVKTIDAPRLTAAFGGAPETFAVAARW